MTIRLTSRCLALGGLGGLPNSFTSSPGPSIQARFSSAQVGKPSSTSASAYMANKKAQETERSNPAEEEFLSFARRLNDARVQKAMNTMLPPKTSSSPTEDVLTITDLENRAAFDVNKLLDTGAPPTVLSSELLGELLAGTRVRYFIGAVLLIVGVYTTTRLELFREWLVLGVFDSERCFVAYAGRAQRAKWALVDELEALVRPLPLRVADTASGTVFGDWSDVGLFLTAGLLCALCFVLRGVPLTLSAARAAATRCEGVVVGGTWQLRTSCVAAKSLLLSRPESGRCVRHFAATAGRGPTMEDTEPTVALVSKEDSARPGRGACERPRALSGGDCGSGDDGCGGRGAAGRRGSDTCGRICLSPGGNPNVVADASAGTVTGTQPDTPPGCWGCDGEVRCAAPASAPRSGDVPPTASAVVRSERRHPLPVDIRCP
eukprot:TRINITY_DN301_c0_g2_i2.p1 TRINITY_DN301_c0_g2~~TRINITY_DN301_c0_g2_i2.p1  ORF type:complete len:434 (+),score=31.15 TRINITY_DN301_c0_g2_i2:179-1480(+)